MSDIDKIFAGSIPEIYDTYLVPLIFEGYARDLAARAAALKPKAVLETAAGSGVVTRALTPLLASDARYIVSDLNKPMLERAQRAQPADPRIEWQVIDALKIPHPAATFDVVCCQFGAMFFPDRVAGYREARRVLKPGGAFLFSVWDSLEANDFANVITEALAVEFPGNPPRFMARTPHGYHDRARIETDLRSAEFSKIEITTVEKPSVAPTPRHPAIAYCQGTPLRSEIEMHGPGSLERATNSAADAITKSFGSGEVSGKIQALVIAAAAESIAT